MGWASQNALPSALYTQSASHPRPEKSLALASVKRNLGISAVARGCLFVPRGGVARQDVSAATDADTNSKNEHDVAEWAASRKVKKEGEKQKAEHGASENVEEKAKGVSQTLNGAKKEPGLRNNCFWRDGEYRLLPRFPTEIPRHLPRRHVEVLVRRIPRSRWNRRRMRRRVSIPHTRTRQAISDSLVPPLRL